jgi:hypothetical protein
MKSVRMYKHNKFGKGRQPVRLLYCWLSRVHCDHYSADPENAKLLKTCSAELKEGRLIRLELANIDYIVHSVVRSTGKG